MIEKHRHNMRNLEQIVIILDHTKEKQTYATFVCFNRDCDYHEYHYVELLTAEIVGVVNDEKET